jgi:hypothetical protein
MVGAMLFMDAATVKPALAKSRARPEYTAESCFKWILCSQREPQVK